MEGGGQFVLEAGNSPGAQDTLASLRTAIQSELLDELQGQLGFNLAWSDSLTEALRQRSRERRRSWSNVMAGPSGWLTSRMSLPNIAPPCEICGKRKATTTWHDAGVTEDVCGRCDEDRRTGASIPEIRAISLASGSGAGPVVLGRRVVLHRNEPYKARLIHRHVPLDAEGNLLTFEQIASAAVGAPLLGVLKADVDDFGSRLAKQMEDAAGLQGISGFSGDLDRFFSLTLQNKLGSDARPIYTVFSGGDDLFLIGPWNDMLAVAIETHDAFSASFGKQYGLTLSAGVAFTPPGIPVRHAASRAERLLRQAKKGTKDQCAALDGVWKWDEIANICGQGRRLARHVEADAAPRTLLHRFYRILSQDDILTPARWSYHMARHFRAHRARTSEEMDFQQWCETVDRIWDQPTLTRAARSLEMARAALLYSLTATRSRRES